VASARAARRSIVGPARAVVLASFVLLAAPARAAAAPAAPPPAPARPLVVVGGDRDYPPYEFLDENGSPAGYNVDLTRAIAEVMGFEVEFRLGGWSAAREALRDGRVDALQGLSHSEARARELALSPPHAIVNHAIWGRKGSPKVSSLEELRGRRVAVHRAGIMDETLTALGGVTLLRTDTPADALRLLSSGEGDYAIVAALPATYIIRQNRLTNVVPVATNVASHAYGHAVRKGDEVLLSRLTEGLAILQQTGRYAEIQERWLGVAGGHGVSWRTFVKYGAVVFVPLLVVLGGTVLWSRSLQREVAERTASLAAEVAERQRAMEELRRNQAQLVQADKMAALGVLVSGVAHEINNPNGYMLLNMPALRDVCLDAAEAFEQRYREEGDFMVAGLRWSTLREELPRMLDEMQEGARRIKRIVDDLKDFARQEDAPRHEPLDVNEVVAVSLRLVDAQLRKATRRLEVACADALPPVKGNAQRIEQVIVNLVLNACQALPDPARAVRISTSHDAARGLVLVAVEDEGTGIPPEDLPRITDPFFTTKRDRGGTGLGLSVSTGIVKEHGGRLDFRPRPGGGTIVILSLPALSAAAEVA
jgi:polar amino acid transport system substrate-binding protein